MKMYFLIRIKVEEHLLQLLILEQFVFIKTQMVIQVDMLLLV